MKFLLLPLIPVLASAAFLSFAYGSGTDISDGREDQPVAPRAAQVLGASFQPAPPIEAALYYPWFPNAWNQGGVYPFTNYEPTLGYYSVYDNATIDQHITWATEAHLEAMISSWWGQGQHTDTAFGQILARSEGPSSPNPNLRWTVYHELEGSTNPSVSSILSDLNYLAANYFNHPGYLRLNDKPVVFVYGGIETCEMADRWTQAKALFGGNVYIVLKVFPGYASCASQPDSWHQYGPATSYSEHLPHSVNVSPGFWHKLEATPRLARDPARFEADVQRMMATNATWRLVTSWNEWGEGTGIEPTTQFGETYLDILCRNLPGTSPCTFDPPPTPSFVFAASGDHGATGNTNTSLTALNNAGARFYLALGDMSYSDVTPESAWCDYVKARVGPTFPFQLISGNHEDDGSTDGFIGNFAACLPDRMNSNGVYSAEYYFDVQGLARVIMIAADLDVNGVAYQYTAGNVHYNWLSQAIDDARASGIPWVIVGMHKVCLTAGNKPCEIGSDLMSLLYTKRVDLVLQAHDHDYQRFKQLTCGQVNVYLSSCVADDGSDGHYTKGAGTVTVISGVFGGGGSTAINTSDPEYPYVANWMGSNSANPGRGFVKFTVLPDSLSAQFVGTTTTFTDSFVIEGDPVDPLLDSDGDGCTDVRELFAQPLRGGSRNPNNFWDVYDTPDNSGNRDRAISGVDVFRILSRFGSGGTATSIADALTPPPPPPAYHAGFDRGPSSEPGPWDLTQADGSISGQDFFAALAQLGTDCT